MSGSTKARLRPLRAPEDPDQRQTLPSPAHFWPQRGRNLNPACFPVSAILAPAPASGHDRSTPGGGLFEEGEEGEAWGLPVCQGPPGSPALCPEDVKHARLASMEKGEVLGER